MGKAEDAIQLQLLDNKKRSPATSRKPGRPLLLLLGGAVVLFVVLALALGLGLGLGLKKHNHAAAIESSSPTPSSSPTNVPSTASEALQPWRRDTSEYALDMGWDLNAAPQTRVFNLTVSEIQAAPDGVVRPILVYNGQFPGPLIRVNQGDRVLVNVTNELTNATTVHWHGLYQNGTNWMDGTSGVTQCPIPPGTSFLYNFTVDNQYGTYWYHAHYSTQYTDGLVGPFIIHSPEEAAVRKSYDFDQIILLQDWYHDFSTALLPGYFASGNENAEPVPDNGLIQGTNYFDCSNYDPDSGYDCQDNSTEAAFIVTQNKKYRLRLINVGAFAEFQFSIDNHTLTVIEADSTLVQPVAISRLPINIAQRYSVILNANQTATNYWIRSHMNTYCFSDDNAPILNPDVRALLTYTNTTDVPTDSADWGSALDLVCEDLSPSDLVPSVIQPAPAANTIYPIEISFQIGAYALDKGYINSTTWVPSTIPSVNLAVAGLHANNSTFNTAGLSSAYDASQFIIDIPSYQVVDVLLNNLDEGGHPFHLHGHQFWVMAQDSTGDFNFSNYADLDTTNPMRRDTLTIGAYGWALIRFKADNPGLWALHCHISWHMEAGLLMQFQTRDDIMKGWTIPPDVLSLCDAPSS